MSHSETAKMITDAITARLRDEFPAWSVTMNYQDNRTYGGTMSFWWEAITSSNRVYGNITLHCGMKTGNDGKSKVIVKSRWGLKPGTFVTRERRAGFITVSTEMTNNAPRVERLIREEVAFLGDPIEILARTARKSMKSSSGS